MKNEEMKSNVVVSETIEEPGIDWSFVREKVKNKQGKEYWKSLGDLSETKEFKEWAQHEFPQEGEFWNRSTTRRSFLQLMGSMIAMAGLAGCTRQPTEKIVPFVKAPENQVPGVPVYFATAIPVAGFARGLLVESHMGRPTKIEGNPQHPDSLGAATAQDQASVLSMYDPDRSQTITHQGVISTWDSFAQTVEKRLKNEATSQGAGLRILTETVISPTLAAQLQAVLKRFPKAVWHQYSPVNRDNVHEGSQLAFGQTLETQYDIKKADVILSIESDFMTSGPGSIRYARDFASRRKVSPKKHDMNRLYAVESSSTLTGAMADHRLPLKPSDVLSFMVTLAIRLGFNISGYKPTKVVEQQNRFISALAKDLKAHQGKSLIIPGDEQPAIVHALANIINNALGNIGKTVQFTETIEPVAVKQSISISNLASDMRKGLVEDLFILGANPVYHAPSDLGFEKLLEKVPFRAHLGLYHDETGRHCHWHIPAAHYLESWSDARGYDGTTSFVQPLISPLYGGKSTHDVVALLEGKAGISGYDRVREQWKPTVAANFKNFWEQSLHDGVVRDTAFKPKAVKIRTDLSLNLTPLSADDKKLEIIIKPDPTVGDGSMANNGWLQELPKPITQMTWDNAILVSPKDAERLGIRALASKGEVVELTIGKHKIQGAVRVVPGQAIGSATIFMGYGRKFGGKIADGIGFDVNPLRKSNEGSIVMGASLKKTGKTVVIATTQEHHAMENRHLVRSANLDEYLHEPDFAQHVTHEPKATDTLYKPDEHLKAENQWGMTVDLNTCIGCGACTTACQSENNIPIVGKDQVENGREMHWMRIDQYQKGDVDNPEVFHQPVACQHCENAPCEPVCPVGATVHSDEGLNEMTYNRCVGTRYCANNCSYKVRRFNFFHYAGGDNKIPSTNLQKNPDVTIRSRGVMEKCTYCVQRISTARIDAKKDDRSIKDGEVVTACQQTCPTQAITFGNINDKTSQVSLAKADERNYGILTDLGTRPRTSYLARVRNPNPELEPMTGKEAGHGTGH